MNTTDAEEWDLEDWDAEMADFDVWKRCTLKRVIVMEEWNNIGDWMYTVKGAARSNIFSHVCKPSWAYLSKGGASIGKDYIEGGCRHCGEEVPDGIKMIVLLTERW